MKKNRIKNILLALVCLSCFSTANSQVVVSEINWANGCAFVEIFNSNNNTVNVGGWTVGGSVSYTFPAGTMLLAGQVEVIYDPGCAPGGTPTFTGTLPANGTVSLTDECGGSEFSVNYLSSWGTGAGFLNLLNLSGAGWPNSSTFWSDIPPFTTAGNVFLGGSGTAHVPCVMSLPPYISEIMYNPAGCQGPDADCEYIVITNPNNSVFDLSGYAIANGMSYTFAGAAGSMTTTIPANGSITLGRGNCAEFTFDLMGGWTGNMNNAGEILQLNNPSGTAVSIIFYNDDDGADGDGQAQCFDSTGAFSSACCPTPLDFDISNVMATAVCSGNNAVFTITWSGTSNGTFQVDINGEGYQSITNGGTYTITGPTTAATSVTLSLRDDCAESCEETITVDIPECPAATCPTLTSAAPAAVVSSESTCNSSCALSGGVIAMPATACPTGSTLEYSINGGTSWSITLPTYNQTTAVTVMTRCICDMNPAVVSPNGMVTTIPGSCTDPVAPAGVTITNSTCNAGTVSGGSFNGLATACTTGVLTFYTNAAGTAGATTTAPSYNQTGPVQTLYMRCVDATTTCESTVTAVGPTVPGECVCPTLTSTAPAAVVNSESTCNSSCTLSGGIIAMPATACPTGSTLEYSINGGTSWSITLPTYNQTTAVTVMTRCICDMNPAVVSPNGMVTTVPGSCTDPVAPSGVTITNSTCNAGTVSGGTFNGLATACTTGVLTFYTNPAGTAGATTTAPSYNQTGPAQTLYMRCVDATTTCESTVTTVGPTVPGACVCPTLTAAAPAAVVSSESTCNSSCALSGGVIAVPATACPTGSTLEYSINGGTSWSITLPTYNQTTAVTVMTRCICDMNPAVVSPNGMVTTVPGSCTDPVAPSGVTITNSTCNAGTVSGGSFNGLATACTTGVLTFYTNAAGTAGATTTAPSYNQTGPAQTLYMRCVDATTTCESTVTTVGPTVPGACVCPTLTAVAPAAVVSSESTCNSSCTLSGGVIAMPATACPTGSSLEYSINGGTSWSITLPTYNQTTAVTVMTRCICDMNPAVVSPNGMVTTVPESCTDPVAPTGVTITNSTCNAGAVSGGSFNGLATACTTGVLTFYTNAAGTAGATTTAPSYNQTGPAQTLYMRCVDATTTCESTVTAIGPTVPGECTCPTLTAAAPAAVVSSESTCTVCSLAGGEIAVPATTCPTGSTLEYSINGGTSWSISLPMYNQTTAVTVLTRCICDMNPAVVSPNGTVTTVPGVCVDPVPPANVTITNSTCNAGTVSGGSFNGFATACATGVLTFYTDPAGTAGATTTAPSYNQTGPAQTLYMKCVDAVTACESTAITVGPTVPGACVCPTLTAAAPAAVVSSESTCNSSCALSGGVIAVPATACPAGSTLEYSINSGTSWSITLPTYNQTTAVTVMTRCICDMNPAVVSPNGMVTTVPGSCTDPVAPAGVTITNSTCNAGTVSGGTFNGLATACATGVLTFYTNAAGTAGATTTAPSYNQTGPAQTLYMRCVDVTTTCESAVSTAGPTVPGACVCPDLSAAAPQPLISSNSTCMPPCTLGGGLFLEPLTDCPANSTLQYSIDGGMNWVTSLPAYNQTTALILRTRCLCDIDNSTVSPSSQVGSTPGTCTTPAAPAGITITESTCVGGVATGGSFDNTATACVTGNLFFYTDAAGTMGENSMVPSYNSAGPTQTIYARCIVISTGCISPVTAIGPTVPAVCSPATISNEADAQDPCTCNADESANGAQDGTFNETVTISSNGAGETWTVSAITFATGGSVNPTSIAVGDILNDNGDGTYDISFDHTDLSGYSLSVTDGVQVLTISNVCTYPVIDLSIPAMFCNAPTSDDAITLAATQTNALFTTGGSFSYFGPGVTGNMFDPGTVAHGSHTINVTYIPVNGTGDNGTVAAPAIATDAAECISVFDVITDVIDCSPQTSCACLPDPNNPLNILGQHVSGAGSGFVTVYVLVDASGNVIATNLTGAFNGLPDVDATGTAIVYTMHPITVATAQSATVIALFPMGTVFSSVDISTYCAGSCTSAEFMSDCDCPFPSIAIDKDDADDTDDTQEVIVGGTATFTINIENDGEETLCDVTITDANGADCVLTTTEFTALVMTVGDLDAFFDPGEIVSYTCTVPNVTAAFTNTIMVTASGCGEDGTGGSGIEVMAEDPSVVTVVPCPEILVEARPVCNGTGSTFDIEITSIIGGDPSGLGGATYTVDYGTGTITYPTVTTISGLTYVDQNTKITLTVSDDDNADNCEVTYDVLQLNCQPQTACDCDDFPPTPGPLTLNAQAAGNGNGFSMFYVLVDGLTSNVVAVNTTGTFAGLSDKNYALAACPVIDYTIHAINVADEDLAAAMALVIVGSPFSESDIEDDYCADASCNAVFNDDCECTACPGIASLTSLDPDVCDGESIELTISGLTSFAKTANGIQDFGINIVQFSGATTPTDPYAGGTVIENASALPIDPTVISGVSLPVGEYTLCAILDALPDDDTCRPSQCITVEVFENPNADPEADARVCFGATTDIDGNPIGGSGIYTHSWAIVNDGGVTGLSITNAAAQIVTVDLSAVNNNTIFGSFAATLSYTVTDDNGCSSEAIPVQISIIIPQCGADTGDPASPSFPWKGNE